MNDVKFKVGDSVVIVAAESHCNSYKYKDGDSGTVSTVFDDNHCCKWCYVDFVDEDGEVQTEEVYFREMKKVEQVPSKTTPTFKVGDKVVFCKSSLDSGMIDAKEGDVFTVKDRYGNLVQLVELTGMYHVEHFEHYVEKEKEMEKKFAKVGDKIRIVAADFSCDYYENGDVFEVVDACPHSEWVDVHIGVLGSYPVYHTEYEIVEDGKEYDFVFTEEHVGMEVFCLLRGKGVISEVSKGYNYPIEVEFGYTTDRYTSEGNIYDDHKSRVLFFSEPKIGAERFPPKKKFTPTLKKGDKVVLTDSVADYVAEVVREEENHIYYKTEDGVVTFVNKSSVNVFKLGEEIKFS